MQRREFITLLGGAAVTWPRAAHAQQADRMRRMGVLLNRAADDPEEQARLAALRQRLQELGWTDGRNVRIDYRYGAGSAEFMAAYEAALAGVSAPREEIGASRTVSGTVNDAVIGYYKSLQFRELAPATQAAYRTHLERLRNHHGGKKLPIPKEFITRAVDSMTSAQARNWVKTMRQMLRHAMATGLCHSDPTVGVRLPKIKSGGGIHTWSEQQIAQYEAHHAVGTKARLALALLLYTAQRRGDVIRMGRQHVRNGVLEIRQAKTRTILEIPLLSRLREVIDGTPSEHLTFLVTKSGQPYAATKFSTQFRAWCDQAGLPQECSAHGLRKAAARRLAEAGCSAHEIAALTGHRTLREVERYTKAADQVRLARQALARQEGTKRDE
jgi:integrase